MSAPGWYPDPDPAAPRGRQRYFDGLAWTTHLHPIPSAESAPVSSPAPALSPHPGRKLAGWFVSGLALRATWFAGFVVVALLVGFTAKAVLWLAPGLTSNTPQAPVVTFYTDLAKGDYRGAYDQQCVALRSAKPYAQFAAEMTRQEAASHSQPASLTIVSVGQASNERIVTARVPGLVNSNLGVVQVEVKKSGNTWAICQWIW